MQNHNLLDPPAPNLRQELPPRRSPLPNSARAPIFLLTTVLLSQPWLILLNLRSFYLMWGEATTDQKGLAAVILACEVSLMTGSSLLAWRLHRRGRPVPWAANWAIFMPHAVFLALVTRVISAGTTLLPASVSQWIVPSDSLLFYQWAFTMPVLFYSALALACFPIRRGQFPDIGLSLLAAAGIPALWYFGLQMVHGTSLPAAFWISATIASSLICLTGFLRLITVLWVWTQRAGEWRRGIMVFFVALAGPIGGLALNAQVPFPTSFQSGIIYTLAVLNGLLLLIPTTNRMEIDRGVWLARCAMLPFSLYFFLVYLPLMPLAIPAMIVAGAGFLILVPTALLLVHARSVVPTLLMELREGLGRRGIGFALLAFCALPAAITGGALLDRVSLNAAIDHVFTPDYRKDDAFRGSRWALQRSLERARDQKQAVYLPFLTEFYDWAVFDGFMLSDSRMQVLHRAFFGRELDLTANEQGMTFNHRRRMMPPPRINRRAFPRTVALDNLKTTRGFEDGCRVIRAVLELENRGSEQAEYVTTIAIPPGALVSGYWLKVGNDLVPGQIFEKKTALWVYRMIRDVTRRDPGLLVYTSPQTLELRVFPFAAHERRTTEIEFLVPPGAASDIEIGTRRVSADDGPEEGSTLVPAANGGRLVVSPWAGARLPDLVRRPYLHFVVDQSAAAIQSPAQVAAAIRLAASHFPAARQCAITLANYDARDLTAEPVELGDVDSLLADSQDEWLPARGAFLRDRVIKRVLLRYREALAHASPGEPPFETFPIIVVLAPDTPDRIIYDDDLAYFATTTPDTNRFYTTAHGAVLRACRFDGKPAGPTPEPPRPVHLFKCGESVVACAAQTGETSLADFADVRARTIEVFDARGTGFTAVPGPRTLPRGTRYSAGLAAWLADAAALENPSLSLSTLPDIVQRSRASGILVPSTSYIVVENSAQWRMLKLKEREKLGRNRALDFMETPEPSVVWVGLGLLLLVAIRRMTASARQKVPLEQISNCGACSIMPEMERPLESPRGSRRD